MNEKLMRKERTTVPAWHQMKAKCVPGKHQKFDRITANGIKVCDEWLNSFSAFFEDMGKRPSARHLVERIDDTKDFGPDNCQWVHKDDAKRYTNSNEWIINGKSYPTAQAAATALGVSRLTIFNRVTAGKPGYSKVSTEPSRAAEPKYFWYAEGFKYESAQAAATALGVSSNTIISRTQKQKPSYYKTDLFGQRMICVRKPNSTYQKNWWIAEWKRYRTADEAATTLGVTVLTIYNRVKAEKPGYFKTDLNEPWFLD